MRELTRPMIAQLSAPPPGASAVALGPAHAAASAGASPSCAAPLYRCSSERLSKAADRNGIGGTSGLPSRAALAREMELALLPELSPSQVLQLRRSWKHVNTKALFEVVKKCFQKLEASHSVILSAFVSSETPPSLALSGAAHSVSPKSSTVVRPPARHQLTRQPNLSAGSHNQLAPTNSAPSNASRIERTVSDSDAGGRRSGAISPADEPSRDRTRHFGAMLTSQDPSSDSMEGLPDRTRLSPSPTAMHRDPAPTVRNVTRYFLGLMQRIMDSETDIDQELKRVGARHVALYDYCGVGVPEIERLGEVFAEAFCKLDGIRQSKETTRAWRILVAKIIVHIRDGFETEMRYQRRKNSQFRPKYSAGQWQQLGQPPDVLALARAGNGPTPAPIAVGPGDGCEEDSENRRSSMPSTRQSSLLDVDIVTRKLSNI